MRYLGSSQLAQCVQQSFQGSMGDIALKLLELLFGENLHEVVNVEEDPIEVDTIDGCREEADHPPQTLDT